MTDEPSMALLDLVRKSGADPSFLTETMRRVAQALMEAELSDQLGAERHERAETRTGVRNGYRERQWDTRVGSLALKIPRVREGHYFPAFLEPRTRGEQALTAVIQEAYVHGMSTRMVDDLVQALGMTGISKSQVSRICEALDDDVKRFRERPLEGRYPYVWLDATSLKIRESGRVVSMALVIATGVRRGGEREVLGCEVGMSEDGAFWLAFLRSLVTRGLTGVQLVISDAHLGSRQAITVAVPGASWQRCRVHFFRNAL